MNRKIIYCVFSRMPGERQWLSECPTDDSCEAAQNIEQARALGREVAFKRLSVHHDEIHAESPDSLDKLVKALEGR